VADFPIRSTQALEAVPGKANDRFVHGVREIVRDAVDEPLFQLARVSVAQLHAHEYQDAFDKDGLAGRSCMPDCLIGVTSSARIVGSWIAAWLDRPKIDPRYHLTVIVAECHGAECRKSPGVIDNERGTSGGHDRPSQNFS
jgi:hypothetical protein